MVSYQIQARRIDDRPDKDGYTSSGRDLPTFTIPDTLAANEQHAARVAHDIAGHGVENLTRTTVQVYWVNPDGSDEFYDSTQYWANGRMVEPTQVMRQYGQGGNVISGGMYDEDDADSVAWFTVGSDRWLSLTRTKTGKWAIEGSDFVHFTVSDYRRRFVSPDEALRFTEKRAAGSQRGTVLVEVKEW